MGPRTTTQHGTPPPRRRHGRKPDLGVPLVLGTLALLGCLLLAFLPGSGNGSGHPAGDSAAVAPVTVPPLTGSPAMTADPTNVPTKPPSTGPSTPPPTATPTPSTGPGPRKTSAAPPAAAGSVAAAGPVASTGSLAGRIKPEVGYRGVATAYEAADGNGACLYGPAPDLMVAAMNHTDYESARACGAYVRIRAAGGASLTVRIVNECPLPCAPGQLDLSRQAFAELADLEVGRIPITWELLSPATAGPMSLRYKTGSSPHWCAVQVIGHRNPVAALEFRTAGGWRRLPRSAYNYFLSPGGSGCGGSIRITDIYGQRLVVDGIAVKPDVVQPARVQFARH
ncbi:expansin EXLX1 family cellulose-binding protein [Streptomyces sp. NPDC088745]|uniref:expansin EXLX1 family cellulose-binding protein n=1 Tax=Streptomyces sp. NPDC088745 TaxID=3365884 RepID=UPI00380628EE